MNTKLILACFIAGALTIPTMGYTEDSDMDRSSAKTYVKDSVITAKVKAKLVKESVASAAHIKVDTDNAGVVWLSGTARTKAEADEAVTIATGTEGVTSVKSNIKINPDR
jgi:hyperosmotically inducible periplasmic protein